MAVWPANGSNVDTWDAALLAWLTETVFTATGGLAVLPGLEISQAGALPVLKLTQTDVSEEFIRLVGTSAHEVLDQSLVVAADVGTATLAGYVKVYVQDDGDQLADGAYYIPLFTLASP